MALRRIRGRGLPPRTPTVPRRAALSASSAPDGGGPPRCVTHPILVGFLLVAVGFIPTAWAEDHQRTPSMMHGAGKIIGGLIFEWPKTIVDATMEGPPIAGTMVGILAGAARAAQTVVAGVVEMATAFDPFSMKR